MHSAKPTKLPAHIYLIPLISMVMSVLYYAPWISDNPHDVLGLYILAFFWFLLAWVLAILFGYESLKLRKINPRLSKRYLIGLGVIAASYAVVWAGFLNGYIVTV